MRCVRCCWSLLGTVILRTPFSKLACGRASDMTSINPTRISDQASLILASYKSGRAIGAKRSTLYTDLEADVHG